MTHTATHPHTQTTYRFRSIDTLARRLGGDTWTVEHDTDHDPPRRTVTILRRQPQAGAPDAYHVVTRLRIDSKALTEVAP